MIDEKKIEEAKRAFIADKKILGVISIMDLSCGFREGANWAINEFLKDLWHPAEEEPNHKAIRIYILGETRASESGVLPMLLRPNTNWKEFVVSHGVTRWLYVDDLLPKKKGDKNGRIKS